MHGEAAEVASHGPDLLQAVALLVAGVIAVPLFKRLGLGSVLGYLTAGLVVGPSALGLVHDPAAILQTAELGVVMFLFVVGLELEPARLWALRHQIFGLGVLQVTAAGLLLTGIGVALGMTPLTAFVAGAGFVLTSTAIVMQVLGEGGTLQSAGGQKIVSVLLFEDLSIVPLLAFLAAMAPAAGADQGVSRWLGFGLALGAVLLLVAVGRWILNPMFRLFAAAKAREVMTAAALLVVLGAALVMQVGGLSMAMGAFLAGVLLSTSSFRHQLEADIEPFRGILLGLFFLAVGMSLDLRVVADHWVEVGLGVAALVAGKAAAVYAVARLTRSDHREALERALLMAHGGEFAFVLYATAAANGIIDGPTNARLTAMVILSMAAMPLVQLAGKRLAPPLPVSLDGIETANGLRGRVLVIGFGRFGQIASQGLLARRFQISIIDNDVDMIRAAATFGFKVYYGDGSRLDILHAAGASHAEALLVCVDDRAAATKIAQLVRHELPLLPVLMRSFDRAHSIELHKVGVHYQIRELLESAFVFGKEALTTLGLTPEEAAATIEEVRERDRQRLQMQTLGDLSSGRDLLFRNAEDTAKEQGVQSPTPLAALPEGEPQT